MSTPIGMPHAQGLYNPMNEHDACGVGFLANIKGKKSHDIIRRGIQILCNLTHRGAVGADPLDGDGAGLMIQTPDAFYRGIVDFELPEVGDYATGIVFVPQNDSARETCEATLNKAIAENDMQVLGWRDVATDSSKIGRNARVVEPKVRQIFVARNGTEQRLFDLMLYVARKQAENIVRDSELNQGEYFYVCSLCSRTVLYKGMLLSDQLDTYFPELSDERVESSIAFVHQRYSTNTFPTWDLAQPFRFVAHNGEINTLRGNTNRMRAREALFNHPDLGDKVQHLSPVVIEGASDTACFDNALEFLVQTGRSLHHSLAMMVPEAWATKANLDPALKGFLEYHGTMMEPWDGPANIAACNGDQICAILDRNGLRPARYWITEDDEIVYASEAGVLDIPEHKIIRKERLAPGKMIMVDTVRGVFLEDREIKQELAAMRPYADYVRDNLIRLEDLSTPVGKAVANHDKLRQLQRSFGYTVEEMTRIMAPMCVNGQEPHGSMGNDVALAVLSNKSKNLHWYFKQLFAQVTNPAIDPLRETVVMSLTQYVGAAKNILIPKPHHCHMVELDQPILSNQQLSKLAHADVPGFRGCTIPILFPAGADGDGLKQAIEKLRTQVEQAVDAGYTVVVLSDRGVDDKQCAIPSLLAVSAVHHHLIRVGKRTQCSLILETGEPREVHHFACLLGYGATAINPYLAFETIEDMFDEGLLPHMDANASADQEEDAVTIYQKHFIKAVGKGLLKIFSKMGISTLQSYTGAQIFEIIGLNQPFVNEYFAGTNSRVEGAGLAEICEETLIRHRSAFAPLVDGTRDLERGGDYHWRRESEKHLMDPETVAVLQHAVRSGSYQTFKQYSKRIDNQAEALCTLRGLFKFKDGNKTIPLKEVEPVENIMRRFCTGAMSLGSISTEAHECLAIAMNRIKGKSNSGEGGEDYRRFEPDTNGDWRRSAIKQVASGRFGVTPHYLVNADELQIKVCQGAKPGEGGHLPGHKVSEYIGWLRYSVPGVSLISPPPHHDIYSIEDLAQLIFDLKNVNPKADIAVKLVSLTGVGTVAAGVSKGHAETVVIAGYDGGTGASPISSIKHAGIPWEIGLAETQQTLVLNDLRGRIRVHTDGQLRTGRDVIMAALLGAEEFGFATIALVTMGCIMMRKCHLNTCPVGVATQDETLRKKFSGKPEHVINFFQYVAEEARELMAELGVRSLDELVGRAHDYLEMNEAIKHWKSKGLDFSKILAKIDAPAEYQIRNVEKQDHGLDKQFDQQLLKLAAPALEKKQPVTIDLPVRNSNRTVGAMLCGEIARRHGSEGLPSGTITLNLTGIAGQSFGAFLHHGVYVNLVGEANDYVGKGMAGGRIVIKPSPEAPFQWNQNSIVGNTVLYGATGGEVYFAGKAGERFCIRNSGVKAVIEGVGDHGCEYMTGGTMICLGATGRNFAAGMSGGFAFVLDEDQHFASRCNMDMVALEQMELDQDIKLVRQLIEQHLELTGSPKAKTVIDNWDAMLPKFVKVFPHEFRRVMNERKAKEAAAV